MKLCKVAVSGWDEGCDVGFMGRLAGDWPALEFGVLWAERRQGVPRYPRHEWVRELCAGPLGGRVTLHLCGGAAYSVIAGDSRVLADLPEGAGGLQINTARLPATPGAVNSDWTDVVGDWWNDRDAGTRQRPVILQVGDLGWLYWAGRLSCLAPCAPLFDASAGTGLWTGQWPYPPTGLHTVGYAGGISDANVTGVLDELCGRRFWSSRSVGEPDGPVHFWIDLETGARDPATDALALDRVGGVLARAHPYLDGSAAACQNDTPDAA